MHGCLAWLAYNNRIDEPGLLRGMLRWHLCPRTRGASRRLRLGMAMASRLMARLKRSRGVSPAASGACSSGRNITRHRRYRRSRRAGCAAYTRTVIMKAESTARPRPQPEPNALMLLGWSKDHPEALPPLSPSGGDTDNGDGPSVGAQPCQPVATTRLIQSNVKKCCMPINMPFF